MTDEKPHFSTIGAVIKASHHLPWSHALYLPRGEVWLLSTKCAVLDPDDCEDEEEEPALARENGLSYALGIQDVRGVVENAKQQDPDIDLATLLKALRYYYDHDAFMEQRA
jgi:hypothetical protein